MKRFNVIYSNRANVDLENLSDVIMYKYKAPITSKRYIYGLRAEIKKLSVMADTLPYYTSPQLLIYGQNTKRINYKEMAIIFAIYGPIVYIHRIIPANAIAGK